MKTKKREFAILTMCIFLAITAILSPVSQVSVYGADDGGSTASPGDMVVPINMATLTKGKPDDDASKLLEAVLLNTSKFCVNEWFNEYVRSDNTITAYGKQSGDYLTFGGTQEQNIRPPADMIYALSVSLMTGVYDAAYTGVSRQAAVNIVKRVAGSLAYRHLTNSSGGWGNHWQSASWAFNTAAAAWFLWDEFSEQDQNYIAKMVLHEANRKCPPTGSAKHTCINGLTIRMSWNGQTSPWPSTGEEP